MAKFTASVPLDIRLVSGEEVVGAAGTTHRISDAIVEEFIRDVVPRIKGTVTWITQDEASAGANISSIVSAAITAHEGSTDPHTGYLRTTEGGLAKVLAIGNAGGTVTISPASANIFSATLTAATTIAFGAAQTTRAGSPAAVAIEIHVTQDSTGGRTLAWPGSVTWIGGTPSPSTVASSKSIYALISIDGGVTWRGVLVGGSAGLSGQVITSDGTNPVYQYPIGYKITQGVFTAGVSISATAVSAADTVVTATSATFDGTGITLEFYSPALRAGLVLAATLTAYWFEDGSQIGSLAIKNSVATTADNVPVLARYEYTPSAGSHTYSVRCVVNSGGGTGNVSGGPGGANQQVPGYLRVFKSP